MNDFNYRRVGKKSNHLSITMGLLMTTTYTTEVSGTGGNIWHKRTQDHLLSRRKG